MNLPRRLFKGNGPHLLSVFADIRNANGTLGNDKYSAEKRGKGRGEADKHKRRGDDLQRNEMKSGKSISVEKL